MTTNQLTPIETARHTTVASRTPKMPAVVEHVLLVIERLAHATEAGDLAEVERLYTELESVQGNPR